MKKYKIRNILNLFYTYKITQWRCNYFILLANHICLI